MSAFGGGLNQPLQHIGYSGGESTYDSGGNCGSGCFSGVAGLLSLADDRVAKMYPRFTAARAENAIKVPKVPTDTSRMLSSRITNINNPFTPTPTPISSHFNIIAHTFTALIPVNFQDLCYRSTPQTVAQILPMSRHQRKDVCCALIKKSNHLLNIVQFWWDEDMRSPASE